MISNRGILNYNRREEVGAQPTTIRTMEVYQCKFDEDDFRVRGIS